MRMRKLGALEVSEIGFGILSFASTYGQAPERAESIRVIRGAHDLGITLFDTAEVYGPWTNEALVGEALAPVRNEVVIATKFGFDVDPATGERRGLNSQPEHIKRATDAMLRRLRTNHIDLLYQHASIRTSPSRSVAGAVHCQPRSSSSRVYWTSRYSIDRPIAFQRRSGPQILVALPSRAKIAVMVAMGSKSREVIYGRRIIGARIRAEGAREAAQKAVRAAAELWSIQMEAPGGPAQPSPTIAQCLNGGYGWLQVKCHRVETEASIPLDAVRRPKHFKKSHPASGRHRPTERPQHAGEATEAAYNG
jgi:hypothetical protein